MRTAALVIAALFVLSGCATQEPVRVVDAACEGASCQERLAETPQASIPAPDACNAARQAAEDCRRDKGACEQQLQAAQSARTEAENSLAEKSAGLSRCQGDLAALQQQSKADEDLYRQKVAAAEQELQAMREARAETEQGLAERGDELGRCLDDMAAIHEQTKTDANLCLQNVTAAEKQLQAAQAAQAQVEQALAEKGAELAALQQKAKADEDLSQQKAAAAEQELRAMREARAEIEQALAERGDELGRCLDDMAAIHEQTKTDENLCLQNVTAAEQELQSAQAARAEAEQALAEQSAELASSRSDLAALQQQADADAERCRQDAADTEQLLQAMQRVQTESEVSLAEKDAELGRLQDDLAALQDKAEQDLTEREDELARCRDDLTGLQDKIDSDAVACEGMRLAAQKHAKDAETAARQLQRMKELEERLRQRLQSDIEAKDVEIERLRSQLSVRVLDRILFQSGSADIMPRGRKVLDSVATAFVDGDETIRVEGHTDTVPIGPNLKQKYYSNWELSTARASSVVRFFQGSHAIEPTRMEAVGFSKYRPIAPNDSEANRQRNRRVEIKLTPWSPVTEGGEP